MIKPVIIDKACSGWDVTENKCKYGHGEGLKGYAGIGPVCYGYDRFIGNSKLLTPPCIASENT